MITEWVIWSILALFGLFLIYGGVHAVKEKMSGKITSYFPAFLSLGLLAVVIYFLVVKVPPFD